MTSELKTPSLPGPPEVPSLAVTKLPGPPDRAWRQAALFFLMVLMSMWFASLRVAFRQENTVASVEQLIAGTADRPFQYRLLVPILFRAFRHLAPKVPLADLLLVIEFLSTFGLLLAFDWSIRQTGDQPQRRVAALLLYLLGLVVTFFHARHLPAYYPSDIPSLLFLSMAFIGLRTRRLGLFYLAFLAGCFNRETIFLASFGFFLVARKYLGWRAVLAHLAVQGATWVSIKIELALFFATNPGDLFAVKLFDNLAYLAQPLNWPFFLAATGFLWVGVVIDMSRIPPGFERDLLPICPVYVLAMLVVGVVHEIRIFGDLLPILTPALVLVLDGHPASNP